MIISIITCTVGHGRNEMHIKFWSENLMGRDHEEDLGIDGG